MTKHVVPTDINLPSLDIKSNTWSSQKISSAINSIVEAVVSETDTYLIELDRWGISNNLTNAFDTSTGINSAIQWAYENGYTNVIFPKGEYLIHEDIPILPQSRTIYDLNGAKFRIQDNKIEKYAIFEPTDTEYTTIKNGILQGDRYSHDYYEGAVQWKSNTVYSIGDKVIPVGQIGGETTHGIAQYYFECTSSGLSSTTEPIWESEPIKDGNTVNDGSVIWTAVHSGTHEWGAGIELKGLCRFTVIENCEIYETTGDGIITSGAYNQKGVVYKTNIVEGFINTDTGTIETSDEWIRTNRSYSLTDSQIQSNGYIALYGNGYGKWYFEVKHYNAYFYDIDGNFISVEENVIWNTPIYFPKNADHVYFSINQPMPDLDSIEGDRFAEFRTQSNVEFTVIRNNNIHHTRRTGMALGYCRQVIVENNEIHHVSGAAPECAIDVEDGNWTNQHYHFERNVCHHNGFYDLILFSGVYITVKDNVFSSTCTTNNNVQHSYWTGNKFLQDSRMLAAGEMIMNANYFYGSYLQLTKGKEKLISNCIFENSWLVLDIDTPYTSTISNCRFTTNNNAKLLNMYYKIRFLGEAVIMKDCVFTGTDEILSPTHVMNDVGSGYIFDGVIFHKTKGLALPNGTYENCKFFDLEGNVYNQGQRGELVVKNCMFKNLATNGGLKIKNATNVKIIDNEFTISGKSRYAIKIEDIDNGIIQDNLLQGNDMNYYAVSPLIDVPSSFNGTRLVIARNTFSTNHQTLMAIKTIDAVSVNPIIINDNEMDDCTLNLRPSDHEVDSYYYPN
ncbi:right-handed parallel beta-helix repeat-containing protein [Jeotgalibacillus marinus]|uniref:Right-handed parallel beta-helix repeat-containing protein n=1 Tax=Jeotgalibacillus marinus TaxID=86667 RepID=A0ABV3Q1L4_9BACL